jgi:type IV secretion system protein TrbD
MAGQGQQQTPGFRIRLHNSLVTPILLAGVPREFAILNWTMCAALVLGLHALYLLPFFIIFHLVAFFFAKRDPYFFAVVLRHIRQKKYYTI